MNVVTIAHSRGRKLNFKGNVLMRKGEGTVQNVGITPTCMGSKVKYVVSMQSQTSELKDAI